jgi:hypothetical protein
MRRFAGLGPILVLVASVVFASTASAELLPDGGVTTDDIARIMTAKHLNPQIATEKDADPLVRGTFKNIKFGVFLFGCHAGNRCDSISLSSGFKVKNVNQALISQWNRTTHFGRAYLDANSEAWVEMDVDLAVGATTEAITYDFDRWASVMTAFYKYVHQ